VAKRAVAATRVEAVLAEARSAVAAGREPDERALRARLGGDREALARLDRVLAVGRARGRVARPAETPPVPGTEVPGTRPRLLRTRPTINANMEVRREGDAGLVWAAVAAVAGWEVRISERPDVRSDYEVRETHALAAAETRIELPLGELPLRVHILGRTRDGRLLRRAVISGLTRAGWNDRWQRRASAS
jgi:hypothetical protein